MTLTNAEQIMSFWTHCRTSSLHRVLPLVVMMSLAMAVKHLHGSILCVLNPPHAHTLNMVMYWVTLHTTNLTLWGTALVFQLSAASAIPLLSPLGKLDSTSTRLLGHKPSMPVTMP